MYYYYFSTLQQLMNAAPEKRPETITLWPNAKGQPHNDVSSLPCKPAQRIDIPLNDIRVVAGGQQTHYIIGGRSFGQGTMVRFA